MNLHAGLLLHRVHHGRRDGAFLFALGYITFLELLAVTYLAVPFVPSLRRGFSPALYPVFGLAIGIYIASALIDWHAIAFRNSRTGMRHIFTLDNLAAHDV